MKSGAKGGAKGGATSAETRIHHCGERMQRGSVLTEYVIVLAGLLVLFTALNVIVDFVVEHDSEFNSALTFPF